MDFNRLLERVKDRVKDKPVATLVATNVATAVVVMGYSWLRNSGLSLRQAIMLGAINVAKVAPGGKALIAKEQQVCVCVCVSVCVSVRVILSV